MLKSFTLIFFRLAYAVSPAYVNGHLTNHMYCVFDLSGSFCSGVFQVNCLNCLRIDPFIVIVLTF